MATATWRKAIAEFIGTFTLIFLGAGAIVSTGGQDLDLLLIALVHGLAIGVMVCALAHVSGAHFNPAVTLGALAGRQIPVRLALVYWSAQLAGGLAGALALVGVFPPAVWQPSHLGTPVLGTAAGGLGWDVSVPAAILVEAILTFFLAFVVYGTGIDPKGSWNAVGGFAIGLTIAIDIMMGGPLTGAAMNPARWFGPAVVSGFIENGYVYWVGPFLGAAVAGLVYARVFLGKTT